MFFRRSHPQNQIRKLAIWKGNLYLSAYLIFEKSDAIRELSFPLRLGVADEFLRRLAR